MLLIGVLIAHILTCSDIDGAQGLATINTELTVRVLVSWWLRVWLIRFVTLANLRLELPGFLVDASNN